MLLGKQILLEVLYKLAYKKKVLSKPKKPIKYFKIKVLNEFQLLSTIFTIHIILILEKNIYLCFI